MVNVHTLPTAVSYLETHIEPTESHLLPYFSYARILTGKKT